MQLGGSGRTAVALVAICLAILLLLCARLLRRPSPPPPEPARRLDTVDVGNLKLSLASNPSVPWFVVGMPATPLLADWAQWGVDEARVLLSPDGCFGAYDGCEGDSIIRGGAVQFKSARCRRDPLCQPKHEMRAGLSLAEASRIFADPGAHGATHAYVRAAVPRSVRLRLAESVGAPFQNLGPYLSSHGATTNLHWDGSAGILAQTLGEKEVSLFEPGTMPGAMPAGPCRRRSAMDGLACPPGALYTVVLPPGLALYIPPKWAHHIVSKAPYTLGAVWRLI